MSERWHVFRFWCSLLWDYGRGNPFTAMVKLKRERDEFMNDLRACEYRERKHHSVVPVVGPWGPDVAVVGHIDTRR